VTDDIQKASFKAESISQEKTAVIVKADVPKVEGKEKEYEKEREKELALRIIHNVCAILAYRICKKKKLQALRGQRQFA